MEHNIILIVVLIAVAGVAAQWVAWRTGLPAIVVLLATGIAAGPGLGLLVPSESFGPLFRPMVGLAVSIIVFEGGLNLDFRELRAAGSGIFRLVVIALPLSWLFGTLAGHLVGGLSWPVALLFGAILVVTGPTVIIPLLRQAKLAPRPASFLKWEGIVNDPIGAVLAVLVLEYLTLSGGARSGEVLSTLAYNFARGAGLAFALGIGLPFLIRWAFRHDQAPEILKTPILLASVLGIYAAANLIQAESGLIAATVFGIVLGNLGITGLQELKRFKESLTVFLVSGLFIMLAADLNPQVFRDLSWPIIGTTLAILLVVRPAAIFLAATGDPMTVRERLLLAWIAPRGIVAAAVAGIAASGLGSSGYPDARLILPMVFSVIAATVVAHGFTIRPLARRLGLASGSRSGLLIVGASDWTIALARTLRDLGVPVILADRDRDRLRPAREAGLRVHCGDILSERSEALVDLRDMDYVLAATDNDAYNALVCARFAPELGRERVYQMPLEVGSVTGDDVASREWRGKVIIADHLRHGMLTDLLAEGWGFTSHPVTAGTPVPPGNAAEGEAAEGWNVLAVRRDGRLLLFSPEHQAIPQLDGTLVRFAPQHAPARPALSQPTPLRPAARQSGTRTGGGGYVEKSCRPA